VNNKRNCIVVFILHENSKSYDDAHDVLSVQKAHLSTFLTDNPDIQLIQDFYQLVKKQKNKNKWGQIKEALALCSHHGYDLIIPELKHYYAHPLFADMLKSTYDEKNNLSSLYCLDQPFINAQNIGSMIDHLRKRRQKHGELIKQGLTRTELKSGNPKAAEIIHRVNRPKVLFSILFSILIEPIVDAMEEKKLAQRKMVDFLNMNDFFAPEGGRWVLSQFQKVYDRLKLNRLALAVEHKIQGAQINQSLINDLNLIAKHLLPNNKVWNEDLIARAQERLNDLKELELILKGRQVLTEIFNSQEIEDLSFNELLKHSQIEAVLNNAELQKNNDLKSA